jgi:hypothetical protein
MSRLIHTALRLLGQKDLAELVAVGSIAVYLIADGRPDATGDVDWNRSRSR